MIRVCGRKGGKRGGEAEQAAGKEGGQREEAGSCGLRVPCGRKTVQKDVRFFVQMTWHQRKDGRRGVLALGVSWRFWHGE